MAGLNENHRRHLLLTFQHLDETMSRTYAAVRQGKSDSPFRACQYDVTLDQDRVITTYLTELRRAMVRIIKAHGITIPEPQISALWAFRSALLAVSNTVEELRPEYMAGFGAVDEAARADLQTISAELLNIVDQLSKSLAEAPGHDISTRLHQLKSPDKVTTIARRLDEIITRRNLVEIRPALAVLVERMEHAELEIAVFGRVSSDKSSLLNFLWQHEILPVGAVPITTIPTRLSHGQVVQVTVKIGTDQVRVIDPAQIEDFVTQAGNPDNCKHVTAVQIELPSSRMGPGVACVDTPGLGALGGQGSAHARAYLPRCDIGLVLVSATVGLTDLDIELVDALRRAGAEIMVLLTKADLLPEHDLASVLAYAQTQLHQLSEYPPGLYGISVRPPRTQLTLDWFEKQLAPLLGRAAALRDASIHHKLQQLGSTVVDVLKRREQAADSVVPGQQDTIIHALLAQATTVLDAAGRVSPASLPTARQLAEDIINQTSQVCSQEPWDEAAVSEKFASVAQAVVAHGVHHAVESLTIARAQVEMSLKMASKSLANARYEDLPSISGVPVFDPTQLLAGVRMHAPAWTVINASMRRHAVAAQLRELLQSRLEELLADYNSRLWQWHRNMLGELSTHYNATAAVLRSLVVTSADHSDGSVSEDIADLEHAMAQFAPPC